MKKFSFKTWGLAALTLLAHLSFAQTPIENQIAIWPGTAPGSGSVTVSEIISDRNPNGGACHLNRVVEQVTQPTIKAFLPAKPNGTAIMLCPGGGYAKLAYDKEGYSIAQWFAQHDITAFVLKNRLPIDGHENSMYVPLQDAQRAMRYIRQHADGFNIDPNKIGVMGGSAGGHLAASLSVLYNEPAYTAIDDVDTVSARPDFSVLMYAVVTFQDNYTHTGSRDNLLGSNVTQELKDKFSAEMQVNAQTPPAFLFHSKADGSVNYNNSVVYADALMANSVDVSLNLYASGGHGVGFCEAQGSEFIRWPLDLEKWLVEKGYTTACEGTAPNQTAVSAQLSDSLTADVTENIQWYRNGEAIDGATQQSYVATRSGAYMVSVPGTRAVSGSACELFSAPDTVDLCNGSTPNITLTGTDNQTLMSSQTGTLQWYLGGQPIDGATDRKYTVTEIGDYAVSVKKTKTYSGDDCMLYSKPVTISNISAVGEHSDNSVTLFPNPVIDILSIKGLEGGNRAVKYQVFDQKGAKVLQGKSVFNGDTLSIDVSSLQEACYTIKLKAGKLDFTDRFCKKQ